MKQQNRRLGPIHRILLWSRHYLNLLLTLSMLLLWPTPGHAARKEGKVTKPVAKDMVTTSQVIPAETLAKHRTSTLLLLHVNDIHDIIKAPESNVSGGMAYIAGYVHQMRAQRPDVLMLDAGDLLQKGDTLGVASKGEATFRALGAIGCDLTVPGNHDFAYGVEQYRRCLKAPGLSAVCAGMEYTDNHESVFPPYKEFKIGEARIAVIGATANTNEPKDGSRVIRKFPNPELGQRIHKLAQELRTRTDLLIVLLHNGTDAANALSKAAPEIQLFVCGHSNEVAEKTIITESGALILEVGRAGQWVGKLDAVVDLDEKKLGKYSYQMATMDRSIIQPDEKLEDLISAWEKQWCPEATETLAQAPQGLKAGGMGQMGEQGQWLGQAMLAKTGGDIVLFHRDFFRKGILPGPVTADDLYKTMQPRYNKPLVTFQLNGDQLKKLLELCAGQRGEHSVSRMAIQIGKSKPVGQRVEVSSFVPDHQYRVVCLQSHVQPPPKHDLDIKPLLNQFGVIWNFEKFTALDVAKEAAKTQKVLKPQPNTPY